MHKSSFKIVLLWNSWPWAKRDVLMSPFLIKDLWAIESTVWPGHSDHLDNGIPLYVRGRFSLLIVLLTLIPFPKSEELKNTLHILKGATWQEIKHVKGGIHGVWATYLKHCTTTRLNKQFTLQKTCDQLWPYVTCFGTYRNGLVHTSHMLFFRITIPWTRSLA